MARARRTRPVGPALWAAADAAATEEPFTARVIAGLDEAGYGPLLGPLAIGAVALRVESADVDPWSALAPLVGRPGATDAAIVVGDSKEVFERTPRGRARLERTALAFHAQLVGLAPNARAFLAATPAPLGCESLAREPWHGVLPERLEAREDELAPLTEKLRAALARAGIALEVAAVRAVPAGELNRSFARTSSKGATHWEQCAPFFAALWERYGADGLELVVDRHGGRMRYGALLRETFPDASVEELEEAPAASRYLLRSACGRRARLTFAEKADARSFAVALASCLAKYARELCMEAFNAHFAALQPGLVPTAGYVTDGRRWLAEAGPAIARARIADADLVRTR